MDSKNLKKAGLKATVPRIKILEILGDENNQHMSAEDIYKAMSNAGDDVGLATVYRVLTQFEAAGLVVRHRFEDGSAVYELDKGEHHDHIVCVECGRVEEFIDESIEKRQHEIAENAGFSMTDHCLYIYGVCADCRAKNNAAKKPF